MLRSIIAGIAALGLVLVTAPKPAQASDEIITGVVIGAVAGGVIAAIAKDGGGKHHESRRVYSRPHHHGHRHYQRERYAGRHYSRPPAYHPGRGHAYGKYRKHGKGHAYGHDRGYTRNPRVVQNNVTVINEGRGRNYRGNREAQQRRAREDYVRSRRAGG